MENIEKAVHEYISDNYRQQAADKGIEWNEKYDAFIKPHVDSLYNQVKQAVDTYMYHFAEPLPTFEEDNVVSDDS